MRVFASTATSFLSNGLGILSDAVSAVVSQELNGQFELKMQYPDFGIHAEEISERCIIMAKPDRMSDEQPFRVYKITKPLNGLFTVYARHIVYDLGGCVVNPFSASTLGEALVELKSNASTDCPFTFQSDKTVSTGFTVEYPKSIWSLLGGSDGSILDVYKGEWEFNGYSCYLWNQRGANRGVTIRYGKNMTGYEHDLDAAGIYTGVYPFYSMNGTVVILPEKILAVEGTFDFSRVLPLDLTDKFETTPTEDQLRTAAQSYIKSNELGSPDLSWQIEFVQLERAAEYEDKAFLEKIVLGDIVTVEFEKYKTHATARAVAVEYNVLSDKYETVTLGKVKADMATTIATQQKEIAEKPSISLTEAIAKSLSDSILNALGGCVRLLDTNKDGMADELYIADNVDPAQAKKVWRWNYQGWAASTEGYVGPYTMGATLDDGLLATFVTAAHLVAGTIQSKDGTSFYLNLDENILRMSQVSEMQSTLTGSILDALDDAKDYADAAVEAEISNTDAKIATEATNRDSAIADATEGIADHIDTVEANVNSALIPMNELLQYIQVGNIGTETEPVYGVKIGKVDLSSAFKAVFTAEALEFYENNVRTAFLSNQKLNANTVRTAALELVESSNMGDETSVDWLVTLDNGYTIKYVGGSS